MKKGIIITITIVLLLAIVSLTFLLLNKKYTIKYYEQGNIKTIEVKNGTLLKDIEIPILDGYEFLYWTVNGKIVDNDYKITSDVTLEPKYEFIRKYGITFDSNGGSSVESQLLDKAEKVQKPINPTKNGYKFITWELNGKAYNFDSIVEDDLVLKAVWEENLYPYHKIHVDNTNKAYITNNLTQCDIQSLKYRNTNENIEIIDGMYFMFDEKAFESKGGIVAEYNAAKTTNKITNTFTLDDLIYDETSTHVIYVLTSKRAFITNNEENYEFISLKYKNTNEEIEIINYEDGNKYFMYDQQAFESKGGIVAEYKTKDGSKKYKKTFTSSYVYIEPK